MGARTEVLVPARSAEAETREKGSRFLARVHRVRDEAEAEARLARWSEEHDDATHLCWAWRLGGDGQERSHDAGEPAGTAGRPILHAIRGRDLRETLVVVIRWFGGVKLGKGGLARAYGGAARLALDAAGVQEVAPTRELAFRVDLAAAGAIPATIARCGGVVTGETYGAGEARFEVRVPLEGEGSLREALREITAGAVVLEEGP